MKRLSVLFTLVVTACGPSNHGTQTVDGVDGGGGGGGGGGDVHLSGTVWAPGNAPGMVPAGQEIPVSGATVWADVEAPDPIPQMATCMKCQEVPGGAVITDARGHFDIRVPPGSHYIIVQKGQFRIQTQVDVSSDLGALPASMTTLPSEMNPDNGMWIPHIALVLGYDGDPMESILGKLGIGSVDSEGTFVPSSAAGKFDLYRTAGGRSIGANEAQASTLVTDLDKMMQYHIIFFPCSVDQSGNSQLLNQPAVQKNVHDYVNAGGRLYVADWAGEWADNIFPAEVELGSGDDTPADAFDRTSESWNSAMFGDSNGSPEYDSSASVVDQDAATWLDGQNGPGGIISASSITVEGNWNRIEKVNNVTLGTDDTGNPVVDQPKVYVTGNADGWDGGIKPLLATYEPTGCGRVMYSTFHTTSDSHTGLIPQERILLYLLLEIGVCKDGPIVD